MNTNLDPKVLSSVESMIQELIRAKRLTFLVIGRTGWGKSSTVNSLFGRKVCPVSEDEATTMKVRKYDFDINRIQCSIFDTPGLCDAPPEAGNNEQYIQMIKEKVAFTDSLWYISRLDETRVTSDEQQAIKIISTAFGEHIWQQAVIVLTFADKVKARKFSKQLQTRAKKIREEIAKAIGNAEIANRIPAVAVDNTRKTTPDGQEWLGKLFTVVVDRLSRKGTILMLLMLTQSIRKRTQFDKHQNWIIRKKFISSVFNSLAAGLTVGLSITAVIGTPAVLGFSAGGIFGTIVGAWFSESKS